ncbi:MAG TPA: hypothetical protein VEP73_08020 [Actinomycetota bacterium]|nr:hypothetical protein [Actinomycetota bacterium]
MARKEREAARRRHAIDRARREAGWEPAPKPREPRPASRGQGRSRPSTKPDGGRRPPAPLKKMEVGDIDRRGRVFERAMVLHPRVALRVYLAVFAVAVLSLFRPELRSVSYFAFAVGMLVIADGQPKRRTALLFVAIAAFLLVAGVVLTVAQLTGRASG